MARKASSSSIESSAESGCGVAVVLCRLSKAARVVPKRQCNCSHKDLVHWVISNRIEQPSLLEHSVRLADELHNESHGLDSPAAKNELNPPSKVTFRQIG